MPATFRAAGTGAIDEHGESGIVVEYPRHSLSGHLNKWHRIFN
jgi:hypothetical protein